MSARSRLGQQVVPLAVGEAAGGLAAVVRVRAAVQHALVDRERLGGARGRRPSRAGRCRRQEPRDAAVEDATAGALGSEVEVGGVRISTLTTELVGTKPG